LNFLWAATVTLALAISFAVAAFLA
jgi:hypothetical protein